MTYTPQKALHIAKEFYEAHFSDADGAFVAGSIMRGEGYEHSDIDMVIMYPDTYEESRRESHVYQGIRIEAFIQTPQVQKYFLDMDVKRGKPATAHMVAEGVVIGKNKKSVHLYQERAKQILDNGPEKLTESNNLARRYFITDLLDDIRDDRPFDEILGAVAVLFTELGDYYLRAQGQWSGGGKKLIKSLKAFNANYGNHYEKVFKEAFTENKLPLISFVEETLEPFGGLYWVGDVRYAPKWKEDVT